MGQWNTNLARIKNLIAVTNVGHSLTGLVGRASRWGSRGQYTRKRHGAALCLSVVVVALVGCGKNPKSDPKGWAESVLEKKESMGAKFAAKHADKSAEKYDTPENLALIEEFRKEVNALVKDTVIGFPIAVKGEGLSLSSNTIDTCEFVVGLGGLTSRCTISGVPAVGVDSVKASCVDKSGTKIATKETFLDSETSVEWPADSGGQQVQLAVKKVLECMRKGGAKIEVEVPPKAPK